MKLKISQKLPLFFISALVLCNAIIAVVNINDAGKAVHDAVENKMEALLESRKSALEHYFGSIQEDLAFISKSDESMKGVQEFEAAWNELGFNQASYLQRLYIENNPHPLGEKEKLDYAPDASTYSQIHKHYHPFFRTFLQKRGYYDIFLFDLNGNLVYTVFKELDYATNLNTGQYKDTDLGNAYRAAAKSTTPGQEFFFDFAPYAPSNGAPASFMSTAIFDENNVKQGVLVFQMPIERINNVMAEYAGLGETGQTFLVGPDMLMRSDGRFTEESTILKKRIDNQAVQAALQGEQGIRVFEGVNGVETIKAYAPFDFMNTRWAIIAELDEEEAMEPVKAMTMKSIMITLGVVALFALIVIWFSRTISKPLNALNRTMNQLADNQLDTEIPYTKRSDEIGAMAQSVEVFKDNALKTEQMEADRRSLEIKSEQDKKKAMADLANAFESRVQGIVETVASAATQLHQTAEGMAVTISSVTSKVGEASKASQSASSNVQTVAAAAEEMNASVGEISSQVAKSTNVVNEAVEKATMADTNAQSLADATSQIGEVVNLINDIAEQINLLALNATIESARAGEAGKGFAVVASEVKNLANQTAKATESIKEQINNMQDVSSNVIGALNAVRDSIAKVNEYSQAIAASVEEQSAVTKDIAANMSNAADGTTRINDNMAEVGVSSGQAEDAAHQVIEAAKMLSKEAEILNGEVKSFLSELHS